MAGPPKTPSSAGAKGQKSILGFFQKKGAGALQPQVNGVPTSQVSMRLPIGSPKKKLVQASSTRPGLQTLTPAPSSDAIEEDEDDIISTKPRRKITGLPSPSTPAESVPPSDSMAEPCSSPSRKVCFYYPPPLNLRTNTKFTGAEARELRRVW